MNTPLRVVIDARIHDGVSGGVQQWVIGLASALSGLDSGAEEYLFLVDAGHKRWLEPYLGGKCRLLVGHRRSLVRRIAGRTRSRARATLEMASRFVSARAGAWVTPAILEPRMAIPRSDGTIERAGANVMHFAFQAGFLTGVPSIYQPWDLQHLHLPGFFTEQQREWRELTYRAFCRQATLVVAPSEWVKRDLIAQYELAPDLIGVVNVPPATEAYPDPTPEDRRVVAERLHLPQRFIYYPAQTWPHKNHVRLFEALALLRADGLVVPLVCTGHRNERHAELVGAATRLGIADDISFLGFLEPLDVKMLYQQARALVFPSLYEGWGLPVVEAFSSGLPVACSNVTSLPELVGDAALVFDPYDPHEIADAIRRLWTDDALATELARRGQVVISRYDWHQTALVVRAYYRQVAGATPNAEDASLLAQTTPI